MDGNVGVVVQASLQLDKKKMRDGLTLLTRWPT